MSYRPGVTLVIPTIPPRTQYLLRALTSAVLQTRPFSDVHIATDLNREGAGATRSRGLATVHTEWTAFLDDDDELLPNHLDVLTSFAAESGADLVYPWFDVIGGTDPFPMFEGMEFNPEIPNMFPITVLARTELLHEIGGFHHIPSPTHPHVQEGEDWVMWLDILRVGGVIKHVPVRTWLWHHHGQNTSGLADRW